MSDASPDLRPFRLPPQREDLRSENERLRRELALTREALASSFKVPCAVAPINVESAEHPFRLLVETMSQGAAILSPAGLILYCNERMAALLGVAPAAAPGTAFSSHIGLAERRRFEKRLAQADAGNVSMEGRLVTPRGRAVPCLLSLSGLDFAGRPSVAVIATDLSDQKRAEEVIASERLARSIIDQAGEAIVVCDSLGRVSRANQIAAALCSVNPFGLPFDEAFVLEQRQNGSRFSVADSLGGAVLRNLETFFVADNGLVSSLLLNATPLTDARGRIIGCVVTMADITAREEAESRVRQLLAEKELILREVHHRIKNNMLSIISLLEIQSAYQKRDSTKRAFAGAIGQIKAMGVLYDKLYRSGEIGRVDVNEYIPALIEEIRYIFPPKVPVGFDLDLEAVVLDQKVLFPLGIVINELITNSMKYAFSKSSSGLIALSLARRADHIQVVYADDGIGLPAELTLENSDGFGMQLISTLVDQLRGSVEIERGAGAKFRIEFPA